MKTRMRFVKTGSLRFIGHLDCMRFFQKAIRRAKLDVAYSQGFSPHQKMSFASPLGVGITSDGEYLDVEFSSLPELPLEEFPAYLNQFMTEEIFVTGIEIMPDTFKNSMSLLRAADYMVVEKKEGVFPADYAERWKEFLAGETITVFRKTKKTEREMNIRPHILQEALSLGELGGKTGECYGTPHCPYAGRALYMQLTSGSETNIKPELVMKAFFDFLGTGYPDTSLQVHRLQMHFKESRKGEGNGEPRREEGRQE